MEDRSSGHEGYGRVCPRTTAVVVGYRLRTVCLWVTVVVVGCRCRTGSPMGDSVWVSSCVPVSDGFTYGRQCMGVVVCAGYVSSGAGYGRVCPRTTGEAGPCSQRVLSEGEVSV